MKPPQLFGRFGLSFFGVSSFGVVLGACALANFSGWAATSPTKPELPPKPAAREGGRPRDAIKAKAEEAKAKMAGAEKPAMSEGQKANLAKLQSDLAAIKVGSQVTQAQKDTLAASLGACADGATKPSKTAVENLASSLSSAMADKAVSTDEKAQIASAARAVLASASVPQAEMEAVLASAKSALASTGLSPENVAVVAKDLQAITSELKTNAPAKPTTGG